jgi:hypothetical protein
MVETMPGHCIEIVEIATGAVVHTVPCPGESEASIRRWVLPGLLNHIGKIDCRLSRGGYDEVDDRLDLDRYIARVRDDEATALSMPEPSHAALAEHSWDAGTTDECGGVVPNQS